MRDYLTIGSTPAGEPCQQVGPNYDPKKANQEMHAFINQLKRIFGEPPEGARLGIKTFPHEFGSYSEVVCYYYDDNEKAMEYAYNMESETPEYWDDGAKIELGLAKQYRHGHCLLCHHEWDSIIKKSEDNQNLSGEATAWCPNCGTKSTMMSPVQVH